MLEWFGHTFMRKQTIADDMYKSECSREKAEINTHFSYTN